MSISPLLRLLIAALIEFEDYLCFLHGRRELLWRSRGAEGGGCITLPMNPETLLAQVAVPATYEYDVSAQDFQHAKILTYQHCTTGNFSKLESNPNDVDNTCLVFTRLLYISVKVRFEIPKMLRKLYKYFFLPAW